MKKLEIIQSKILSSEKAANEVLQWRFRSKTIVFTNGVFDLLHRGHVTYLSQAADLGDVLVVGINSDLSAKKLNKGANRPIQDEQSRALIAASLHFVTAVVIFDEETPAELIKIVQPDVLVKGGDWKPEQIAGYDTVINHGGKVLTIDFVPGYSTTALEQKIRNGK
ncbi:MAG: adenylyltransferase/cytidyltransferase family protein [Bacteroidia bacterium]|nr:adenylyltransferase/cytidyltransferase family protein [Bacteroidia bacterium]